MADNLALLSLISVLLLLASVFFVAAEYSVVTSRRSKIEAMRRKGSRNARKLLQALDDSSNYVAGCQMAISMIGIATGSVTEPFVTGLLQSVFGETFPRQVSFGLSLLLVTYIMVVLGELTPKYLVLRHPERVALLVIQPFSFFIWFLRPLSWLAQTTTELILKLFRIKPKQEGGEGVPKEELLLLVRTGESEGLLDAMHADMVARALSIDKLTAHDIMIHRLDIKWLELEQGRDEVLRKIRSIPHSRIPVCRGDIDEVVGIAYLHDIVKNWHNPEFSLERILRPHIAVPENLPLEKIVSTMRESKTQILIVLDEYGGTSGLITLEDVVEEVFGELEDRLESDRPPIEVLPGRISAKADVRLDELLAKLKLDLEFDDPTDTLATVIMDKLGRVPKPGDSIETALGTLRVENMARQRVTRVSVQLNSELSKE